MDGRLPAIEQRYEELESLSAARRQALEGALALYRMFSEADACQLWVEEKEQWLYGMEIPTKLEDLEVVQQRLVCGGGEHYVYKNNNNNSRHSNNYICQTSSTLYNIDEK